MSSFASTLKNSALNSMHSPFYSLLDLGFQCYPIYLVTQFFSASYQISRHDSNHFLNNISITISSEILFSSVFSYYVICILLLKNACFLRHLWYISFKFSVKVHNRYPIKVNELTYVEVQLNCDNKSLSTSDLVKLLSIVQSRCIIYKNFWYIFENLAEERKWHFSTHNVEQFNLLYSKQRWFVETIQVSLSFRDCFTFISLNCTAKYR